MSVFNYKQDYLDSDSTNSGMSIFLNVLKVGRSADSIFQHCNIVDQSSWSHIDGFGNISPRILQRRTSLSSDIVENGNIP
jgi:hypothetical protein